MTQTTITQEQLGDLATYMDDAIREDLHNKMAPCSPTEFWTAYVDIVGIYDAAQIAALAGVEVAS